MCRTAAQTYPTQDYPTFEDAFEALMAEPVYRENTPASAALACAGKSTSLLQYTELCSS